MRYAIRIVSAEHDESWTQEVAAEVVSVMITWSEGSGAQVRLMDALLEGRRRTASLTAPAVVTTIRVERDL